MMVPAASEREKGFVASGGLRKVYETRGAIVVTTRGMKCSQSSICANDTFVPIKSMEMFISL
jgi:hypothetical protein